MLMSCVKLSKRFQLAATSCVAFAVLALLAVAGCSSEQKTSSNNAANKSSKPRPSVTLRVLVVNEPQLTKAIERLRGEWAERSGGELEGTDTTWPDLAKGDAIDADLVVFPSRYLGEMCARGWLRPVRQSVLDSREV